MGSYITTKMYTLESEAMMPLWELFVRNGCNNVLWEYLVVNTEPVV